MSKRDVGLLMLRLVQGGLVMGHGAQKLFGWFEGSGLQGTAAWLESLGMKPGSRWAPLAGLAEFGGGLLITLGLLHPLGPIGVMSAMGVATAKVHWGKPIWVTKGGAELPVTNMAIALGLALIGPGRYSLDHALKIRVPLPIVVLAATGGAAGLALGIANQPLEVPTGPAANAPEHEIRDRVQREARILAAE